MEDNDTVGVQVSCIVDESHCTFEPHQCCALHTLNQVINYLAIAMVIAALVCATLLRKYQSFQQRILIHILLSTLLYTIGLTIPNKSEDEKTADKGPHPACIAQGYAIQVLGMVMVMWVCSLTIYLYQGFLKGNDISGHERYHVAVCWLVPPILGLVPFMTSKIYYGPSDTPYCWIDNTEPIGDILRFALYWIPVFLAIVGICIAFIYMLHSTRKSFRQLPRTERAAFEVNQMSRKKKYLQPLSGYAVAFVIFHAIMVVNRIQNCLEEPVYGLVFAHVFSSCIYGPVLATIFVITNGRESFTLVKFKESIYYYTHTRCCKENNLIRSLDIPNIPFTTTNNRQQMDVFAIEIEARMCPADCAGNIPEQSATQLPIQCTEECSTFSSVSNESQ